MKKFLLVLMCLLLPVNFAGAEEKNLEDANEILICAMSSMAAYSGDDGAFVRKTLTSRGFKINQLLPDSGSTNVKAYLIDKEFPDGRKMKIFVVAGTEDMKDAEVDAKVGRTALHEGEEFQNDPQKIFVHKGFRDYADNALSEGVAEFLIDELQNNPNETLYLTGHSLGGAVALMTAVRLADAGVDKSRMKVISFGAPSVGNHAFAENYSDKIDLTRVVMSGDIVKKSLTALGYVHFGKVVTYTPPKTYKLSEHKMIVYLDEAIRNYCDAGGLNGSGNFDVAEKISVPIFVTPLKVLKESFEPDDEKYIRALLKKSWQAHFSNVTFADPDFVVMKNEKNFDDNITPYIEPAQRAGCKIIVSRFLKVTTIKENRMKEKQLTMHETFFDLEGMPVSMRSSTATTVDLTAIEAAVFIQERLQDSRAEFFADNF